jgi:predicted Zn finger-like uncharacterized protein
VIVTCEKCSTSFQLDDSRVPKRGVNVRCSRCKHAFRVLPESAPGDSASDPVRRARGESDTKEITQDVPQSPGDSRSQSGERRRAKQAEPSLSQSGENEESDWRFNDESHTNMGRGAAGEEKPDPPEAPAPSRNSRLGNEWFGGGDDAPLELDNRSRNAAPEPAPVAPARAEPAIGNLGSGLELDSGPLHAPEPEPAAAPAPAPEPVQAVASAPDPDPEPSFDTGFDGDLASLGSSRPKEPEAAPLLERSASSEPADELGNDAWDLLSDAAEAEPRSESPEPVKAPRGPRFQLRIGDAVARVVEWVGHVGTALGWLAATSLFGYGLYHGLAPVHAAEVPHDRVAGLEVTELDSHTVENVHQGPLVVVSGRVRNPGAAAVDLRTLALELLDAHGEPLATDRIALHAPVPRTSLREAASLGGLAPLTGSVASGEERSFEVVLTALPQDATSFRLVAGSR